MKHLIWLPIMTTLTACGYVNTEVVEYRQVQVAPVVMTTKVVTVPVVAKKIVTRSCCPTVVTTSSRCCQRARPVVINSSCCPSTLVTDPLIYRSYSVFDTEPFDVTTTSVEYY